jgi:O-methyltransferase domain
MQTGQPAAERLLGMSTYEYFDRNPEESMLFDQSMRNFAMTVNTAIVASFDFSPYPRLVDVGGGDGSLLTLIHEQYPSAQTTLFERPLVIEKLGNRSSLPFVVVAGDFFKALPETDLYLFKEVCHNWSDEQCIELLRTCHRASPGAAILVSEQVIGSGHNFAEWLDVLMGLEQYGRERTQQEYEALFEQAGYRLSRVLPTQSTHTLLFAEVSK